jgi:hypothetical protein
MTELEITDIPPLTANQRSLVDMHTVLNIFNVLRGDPQPSATTPLRG